MGYVDSYNLSFKSHFKTGLLCLIGGLQWKEGVS